MRRSTGLVFAVVASLLVVACGTATTSPSPASTQAAAASGAPASGAASQPAASQPAASAASAAPAASSGASAEASQAAGGGTAGGSLIFGGNQEPAGLDPYSAITVDALQVTGQIYETLLNIPQGQLTPVAGLATEWTNNADFTEFTLKLRPGVKFQNGDPLDAAAVAGHFDRLKNDSATPSTVMAALKPVYTGATVVDPTTVTLKFNKPQTAMYITLADPGSAITDAKYVTSVGADAPRKPMGSGPFSFVNWVQGVQIELAKNPEWTWGNPDVMGTSGPAKLDKLTFKYLNDPQTRTAAVEAGDVHFIDLVPFQNLGSLRTNDKLTTLGIPLPGLPQGNWMNTQIPPFDDLAVRQAAEYAVDRPSIISTVYFDLVKPAYGPLTPDFPDYEPAVETMYPFDPEKAKSLLDGAGWKVDETTGLRKKDGKLLTIRILENRGWNDWVTVLQDQLRNVGFDAQVVTEEGGGYYAAAGSQQYEMPAMGSIDTNPVQVMSYSTEANLAGGVNGFGKDPKIEEMYKTAVGEVDPAKRSALVKDWQKYVMENAYWVSIFEFQFFSAFDKTIQGLKVDGTGFYKYFANVTMS